MHKPDKPNRHLIDELREEWPGILRWMIDGCLAWQHLGLQQPALVFWSTDAYFTEQDLVAQWIEECCEIGSQLGTANGVLFASWQDYSEVRGEQARTSRWLSSTLEQRGYLRDKDCELFRGRGFRGLRVRLISQPRPRKSGT